MNVNTKTKIVWFLAGCTLSWITFNTVRYLREHPRDYTQHHPASSNRLAPDWMTSAYGIILGPFSLFSSADHLAASAWIHPTNSVFPSVSFEDTNIDGRVDSIQVLDSDGRSFFIDVVDGKFNAWRFFPEIASDALFFADGDMDGQYDYQASSDGKRAAKIGSKWYDLVFKDGVTYALINGIETKVEQVNLTWRIADQSPE